MPSFYNLAHFTIWLVDRLLSVYSLLILVRALLSWFPVSPYNRFYYLLIKATEPVLAPLRRVIPVQGIDLSPLVAILLINYVIRRIAVYLLSMIFGVIGG